MIRTETLRHIYRELVGYYDEERLAAYQGKQSDALDDAENHVCRYGYCDPTCIFDKPRADL
jgi:hypothetical protein